MDPDVYLDVISASLATFHPTTTLFSSTYILAQSMSADNS